MHKKFKEKISFDKIEFNVSEAYKMLLESTGLIEIVNEYCNENLDEKHLKNVARTIKTLQRNIEVACYRLYKIINKNSDSDNTGKAFTLPQIYKDCEFVFDED